MFMYHFLFQNVMLENPCFTGKAASGASTKKTQKEDAPAKLVKAPAKKTAAFAPPRATGTKRTLEDDGGSEEFDVPTSGRVQKKRATTSAAVAVVSEPASTKSRGRNTAPKDSPMSGVEESEEVEVAPVKPSKKRASDVAKEEPAAKKGEKKTNAKVNATEWLCEVFLN